MAGDHGHRISNEHEQRPSPPVTRDHGPVTGNKSQGIAVRAKQHGDPCEHDASPCLGHATVCSGCPLTILLGSLGTESAVHRQGKHSAEHGAL